MQKENEIQWTMTFSPNGKYVASGGRQKVNLWETKSGKRVHIIDLASSGYVKCIAFSPDNQHLAAISGNAGQDLQVFRLPKSDSLSE